MIVEPKCLRQSPVWPNSRLSIHYHKPGHQGTVDEACGGGNKAHPFLPFTCITLCSFRIIIIPNFGNIGKTKATKIGRQLLLIYIYLIIYMSIHFQVKLGIPSTAQIQHTLPIPQWVVCQRWVVKEFSGRRWPC